MSVSTAVNKHATWIKWVSIALIIAGAILILRQLVPLGQAVGAAERWIAGLGPWGPVAFGVIYVAATVLFLPGLVLTLAAGATFGLLVGTITVSIASTIGASLAFLIARFVARRKVAELAGHYPRFRAVDRAIGEGGWKIVALLRLSPAVPFNAQNYLYGLTPIRFWPYVLASWPAMLPGTFLYVFIGHIGRRGVEAAAGQEQAASLGRWLLLGIGLAATLVVTVYVTRLAQRKLREQTDLAEAQEQAPAAEPAAAATRGPRGWPWGATLTAAGALAVLGLAGWVQFGNVRLPVGPPQVALAEAYEPAPGGPDFDHARFDALLRRHVDDAGWIDYEGFRSDVDELDAYVDSLAEAPFEALGRDEKLALLINAYNAFTIKLILEHSGEGLVDSIKDIPADRRWEDARWRIGSHTWSLNQIEHEQIRPKFKEPRIHFALVCAAIGCPPLRDEAYEAERIDAQLEDQTRYVHEHDRWFRYDAGANAVHLTELYRWYGGDFEQVAGSVLEFAARYAPDLREALRADRRPAKKWIDYDWRLNSLRNKGKLR